MLNGDLLQVARIDTSAEKRVIGQNRRVSKLSAHSRGNADTLAKHLTHLLHETWSDMRQAAHQSRVKQGWLPDHSPPLTTTNHPFPRLKFEKAGRARALLSCPALRKNLDSLRKNFACFCLRLWEGGGDAAVLGGWVSSSPLHVLPIPRPSFSLSLLLL